MVEYSEAFRKRMVQKMSGPRAVTATALAAEIGMAQPTLSRWLREASIVESMAKVKAPPASPRRPTEWSAEEKLRVLVAAASATDADLGALLRREGLQEEDLARFRAEAIAGLASSRKTPGSGAEQKRIKELEKELKRKDAALAETAALLVLRKKAVAFWGEEGDDT